MRVSESSPSIVDLSNVVNLSFYRREKRRRTFISSSAQQPSALRSPESSKVNSWRTEDYRERMKVNAAVIVFVIFLVASGVWLMDGLRDSFGPQASSYQHFHTRNFSLSTAARPELKMQDLF